MLSTCLGLAVLTAAALAAPVLSTPAAAQAAADHHDHSAMAQAAPAQPAPPGQPAQSGQPAQPAQPAQAAQPRNPALPAAEEGAKAAIESSPRHGEWAEVKVAGREAPVKLWVVYPERKDKAPVVMVISEIFGLSDWIRGVADQLAKDGFIAIAPDFISGKGPNGGGTDAVASRDEVVKLIRSVTPDEQVAVLNATRDYALKLPAANGKVGTVGFCWGGSASFNYATAQPALHAAAVFYGSSPDAAKLGTIKAPVMGLYGGNDARVNATIPPAEAEMKKLGKAFTAHVYEGAGHGFLRQQSGQEGANMKASEQAWPAVLAFFRQHLGK
jgi:carboxymethylenebutenolidase